MKPKMRFNGFDGEWEKVKLGEVLHVNSGRDYKHLNAGCIPVYGTGGYMLSVNECLSNRDAIGIGRKGTIDKPQFLKAPFWTVDTLFFLTTKENEDLDFLYNLSQKIKWRLYEESTGVPSLSKTNISKIDIPIPSLPEQQAIASYFSALDRQIASAEKKVASLKQVKAASLQSMFPQEGETVPKVRFKGFDGEWKKVKLGDVATRYDNLRIPVASNKRTSGTTPYYGANGIQDYVNGFTHDGEFVLIAEDGANDLKDYPTIYVKGRIWVNNHAHVIQGTEKIDNYYLHLAIKLCDIESIIVGGSRAKLNASSLMGIEIGIPSLPEQQAIASYFSALDKQIALHAQRLEKLRQIKSACLNKMFV